MGIPDHMTCLLRNLYAGQEATVRTGYGRTDWFQIGKGVHQGCILSPCLFNLYAEYIIRNAGLHEAQAGIKISGRKTMNFTFFSSAHRTFSRIDHILGHKSSLDKFKKTGIIPSIFSHHNAVRLDVNYRKKNY